MKRKISLFMLAVCASVFFASCSDDTTNEQTDPVVPPTIDPAVWTFDDCINSQVSPGNSFYDYISKGYTAKYGKGVMDEQRELGEEFVSKQLKNSSSPQIQRLYGWDNLSSDEILQREQAYCNTYCQKISNLTLHELLVTLLRNSVTEELSCITSEFGSLARKTMMVSELNGTTDFDTEIDNLSLVSGLSLDVIDSLIQEACHFQMVIKANESNNSQYSRSIKALIHNEYTPAPGDYFCTMKESMSRASGDIDSEITDIILEGYFLDKGDEQYIGDFNGSLGKLVRFIENVLSSDENDMRGSLSAYLQLCHMYGAQQLVRESEKKNLSSGIISGTFFGKTLLADQYIRENITQADIDNCKSLAEQFRSTFRDRLGNLDWMSPTTKTYAKEKLDNMYFWYGVPSSDLSVFDVTIENSDMALAATQSMATIAERFFTDILIPTLKKGFCDDAIHLINLPSDLHPYSANACYDALNNSMDILASNLIAPITRNDVNLPYTYAVLGGTTIGHEMCHGFDVKGSKYDKYGNLNNWWALSDALKYKEKQDQMIFIFNQYSMTNSDGENFQVDGTNTLGENMADLGGVTIGLDALCRLRRSQGYDEAEIREQMRRYFLSWALGWSENTPYTTPKNDVHSPKYFRVIGCVNQFNEWYDIFNVQYGDKYYLEPNQRVTLW